MATQHGNSYLPLDQQADQAKAGIRERLQAGETISYSDVESIDDMRWDEICNALSIIEIPGTGYRSQPSSRAPALESFFPYEDTITGSFVDGQDFPPEDPTTDPAELAARPKRCPNCGAVNHSNIAGCSICARYQEQRVAFDAATVDALLMVVRHPRYPVSLLGIASYQDQNDFQRMLRLTKAAERSYVALQDKREGTFHCIAIRG